MIEPVNKDLEGLPQNFMSHDVRKNFIKKVFAILTTQVLLTVLIVVLVYNNIQLRKFFIEHWIFIRIVCFILFFLLFFFLYLIKRLYPLNFLVLYIFTINSSILVSQTCLRSNPESIYSSCTITLSFFILLSLFAYLNIVDLTKWGSVLYYILNFMVLLTFVLLFLKFFFQLSISPFLTIIWVVLLILSLIYIVYDLQLILGNGANKLSEEDYIIGVILLYVDLINVFQIILDLKNIFD